ncbi:MAG: glutathione S-transferase C-terminal domain-containing protein, partial [Gammaproteobacteria bacterium]
AGLAPAINSTERAKYYQWMFYVPGTMEPPLFNILLHTMLLPEGQRIPAIVEPSRERFLKIANVLDHALKGKPYILGDRFSTADIMIATTLQWVPELMEGFAELEDYSRRLLDRPAYRRIQDI